MKKELQRAFDISKMISRVEEILLEGSNSEIELIIDDMIESIRNNSDADTGELYKQYMEFLAGEKLRSN